MIKLEVMLLKIKNQELNVHERLNHKHYIY